MKATNEPFIRDGAGTLLLLVSDPYPKLLALMTIATQELFAIQGLLVTPSATRGKPPRGRQILASIGFGGRDMKGALVLLADTSLWESLAPADQPEDPALLSDMVGEHANMLLGRLRNMVLPLGAEVATAMPSSVSGSDLALDPRPSAKPEWHVFRSDRGPLFVRLTVAFRKDFAFAEETPWSIRPNAADLLIF